MAKRALATPLVCLFALIACSQDSETPPSDAGGATEAPAPAATPAPEIPNIIVELPEEQPASDESDDSSPPAS